MTATWVYRVIFTILTFMCFLGEDGQLISLTIASAITICLYLYEWYNQKNKFQIDTKIYVAWIFVFLTISISSFFSVAGAYAIPNINKYAIAFLLYLFFSNRTNNEHLIKIHDWLFVWSVVISTISLTIQLIPSLQSYIPYMNLLYKAYGHNHVVNILLFSFPICLHKLNKRPSIITISGILLIFISIISSYSRGALILLSGYSAYFVLSRPYKLHTKILVIGLISIASYLILMFFSYGAPTMIQSLSPRSTYAKKSGILDSRIHYWNQAIHAFKERPLFGYGPGTFKLISKKFLDRDGASSLFAHSYLLQTASETGMIGGVSIFILVILLLAAIKNSPAYLQNKQENKNIYHGILLTILYSLTEINLDFSVIWVVLWVLFGTTIATNNKKTNTSARLLSIIMLIYVSYFYTSSLLGQFLKKKPEVALKIQPYNSELALLTLDMSKNTHDESMNKLFTLFYREDPEVLSKLLESNRISTSIDNKNNLYKKIIRLDPFNKKNHESHLNFLFETGKTDDLYEWTFNYLKTHSPQNLYGDLVLLKETPSEDLISMKNEFRDIVYGCCGEDVSIGKIFYLLGIKQINSQPSNTNAYWTAASVFLPRVAYLYIERAGYLHFKKDILYDIEPLYQECLSKAFYEKQCTEGISKLQPPGYFYSYMIQYPPQNIFSTVNLPD